MKTLHITNHIGTIKNLTNVFKYLKIHDDLITESCTFPNYIDFNGANVIWNYYKEKILDYNCLFFTDTSMYARPFLQNMNDHNLIIIVYITNRFDFGTHTVQQRTEISELYSSMSTNTRVFFCSDNRYDKYYASLYGIKTYHTDIIRLTPIIHNTIILPINDKLFIHSRGTNSNNYLDFLKNFDIQFDIFGEKNNRYRDEKHICEYIGFFHLPYQTNIQSLWENLGYFIIYFIPSKKFLKELIHNSWYYFEEKFFSQGKINENELLNKSIDLAEWYQPENECMFEYFDNWEELNYKFCEYKNNKLKLIKKKEEIKNNIEKNNIENIEKWEQILL